MEYHHGMCTFEVECCFNQHIMSVNMLEELMFAHTYFSTYELEFTPKDSKVIKNLRQIRGTDCQVRDDHFWNMLETVSHPKIKAIFKQVYNTENVNIEMNISQAVGNQVNIDVTLNEY